MRYEIESRCGGGWAKVQWCADHGESLQAARRSLVGLQSFLGGAVRIVVVHSDGRREPVV